MSVSVSLFSSEFTLSCSSHVGHVIAHSVCVCALFCITSRVTMNQTIPCEVNLHDVYFTAY